MSILSDLLTFVNKAHYVVVNPDLEVVMIWGGLDAVIEYYIVSDVGWELYHMEGLPVGSTPKQIRAFMDDEIQYPPAPNSLED